MYERKIRDRGNKGKSKGGAHRKLGAFGELCVIRAVTQSTSFCIAIDNCFELLKYFVGFKLG